MITVANLVLNKKGENKMKKLLLSTLLLSTGILAISTTTFAAETTQDDNPVDYNSDVSIKFEEEKGSNTKGPYSGRLSFTWAPKSYNFGSQKIKFGTGVSYDLESASKDSQYIVVNEDRKDDDKDFGKKWDVKVKMSELAADEAGTDKLPATLTLGLGDIQEYHIGTKLNADGKDLDPAKPWDDDVMTDYTVAPGDVKLSGTSLTIPADGKTEVPVMSQTADRTGDAKKREGWGTKINSQNLKFVTLDTSVAEKEYKGNLTWTLTRDITE